MTMRSSNNPYGSFTEGTDKRIGDAFPVIEAVYKKLPELEYLAANLHLAQTGQIELRNNSLTSSIEWRYANQEAWNVLLTFSDHSTAVENTVVDLIHNTILAGNYTMANLPIGTEGQISFCSNGRKVGQGAGAGTGVPVYYSAGVWRVMSTDAIVTV